MSGPGRQTYQEVTACAVAPLFLSGQYQDGKPCPNPLSNDCEVCANKVLKNSKGKAAKQTEMVGEDNCFYHLSQLTIATNFVNIMTDVKNHTGGFYANGNR